MVHLRTINVLRHHGATPQLYGVEDKLLALVGVLYAAYAEICKARVYLVADVAVKRACTDAQRKLYRIQRFLLRHFCTFFQQSARQKPRRLKVLLCSTFCDGESNKAVFDNNACAKLGRADDGFKPFVDGKVITGADGIILKEVELKALRVAIKHGRLCGAGALCGSGEGGQIAVNAILNHKTAILDSAGVGVSGVGSNFVNRFLFVCSADIAESDKVGLVKEKNSFAHNRLISAVCQSEFAECLVINNALFPGVKSCRLALHKSGSFQRGSYKLCCLFAQRKHGLLDYLLAVEERGLCLDLLGDLRHGADACGLNLHIAKGGVSGGYRRAFGLCCCRCHIGIKIGDFVCAHAGAVDDFDHIDDRAHARADKLVNTGYSGRGCKLAAGNKSRSYLLNWHAGAAGFNKFVCSFFFLVFHGCNGLYHSARSGGDFVEEFCSGFKFSSFLDEVVCFGGKCFDISAFRVEFSFDLCKSGFDFSECHFSTSVILILVIVLLLRLSRYFLRSSRIFSATSSQKDRAFMFVSSFAGRATTETSKIRGTWRCTIVRVFAS
nr:MAG TPA: hypothetical protein [Caudoviricetes sp.]